MAPGADARRGTAVEHVDDRADLLPALARCGLADVRRVLVSVGGAGGMQERDLELMRVLLRDHVLPMLAGLGAMVIDGGTDSGVMRAMGTEARGTNVPLVGVAAVGTVRVSGLPAADDAAVLEPHHTAVLLVPGTDWGDESPWLGALADAVGGPSATLLCNGGEIAYEDVRHSVDAERLVVAAAGTGRTADQLAAALRGDNADPRAVALARSGFVRAVDVSNGAELAAMLMDILSD